MKKLIPFVLISVFYVACTGNKGNEGATSQAPTSSASSIALPYKADYDAKFSWGSDSNTLVVLNSYKAWENGDMQALRNTLGDSTRFLFSNGTTFYGTSDSMVKFAAKVRDSLSKVEIRMDVWLSTHADTRNADWVSVWYTETDTYKTGKVDSAYFQDDNALVNGKIVYVDSKIRKLK
ncbi:MAG: hypothetical protein KGM98_11515 [Bacteroidota bacterium]|nr:hypothetical protein [Bacteroidota bacterium]